MRCEICGKTTTIGKKVAHNRMYITNRTSRKFRPNLQKMTIATPAGPKKITVCTRCMRTMRKNSK